MVRIVLAAIGVLILTTAAGAEVTGTGPITGSCEGICREWAIQPAAAACSCAVPCNIIPFDTLYADTFNREYLPAMAAQQYYDVRLARLGVCRAADACVKVLAQEALSFHQDRYELYNDHVLESYAMPWTACLTPKQCAGLESLERLSGAAFDRQWMLAMMDADQQDIRLAQLGAEKSSQKHLRKQARQLVQDTCAETARLQQQLR